MSSPDGALAAGCPGSDAPPDLEPRESLILLVSIFAAGLCGLIYELLIASAASYLLGDSIRQFSLTIGVMMTAMGVGAWLSRLIQERLLDWFIGVEVALGLVGGSSIPLLYALFLLDDTTFYYAGMVGVSSLVGALIGLELPLLTRILEGRFRIRTNISNVLSLDYLGALGGTLLFPFLLLPLFGNFRASLLTGAVNLGVAFLNIWWFRRKLAWVAGRALILVTLGTALLLALPFFFAADLERLWQNGLYDHRVVYSRQTPYQTIVLTRSRNDIRLFLDGHLQFSSLDEHRYHESLVHPALALIAAPEKVLLLGAGDGLATRELLKYPAIAEITVVDLDPAVTELARRHPLLTPLNQHSLDDPRVRVVNADAFTHLRAMEGLFDLIIADLPDPSRAGLAKLYSEEFYRLARGRLAVGGMFVTQATSPYAAPDSFWCIHDTLAAAGFARVIPYHAHIPSFGDWGFVMAGNFPADTTGLAPGAPTRFLDQRILASLFVFPPDRAHRPVRINTIDRPELHHYYLREWMAWPQ